MFCVVCSRLQQSKSNHHRAILYVTGDALRVVDEISKVGLFSAIYRFSITCLLPLFSSLSFNRYNGFFVCFSGGLRMSRGIGALKF